MNLQEELTALKERIAELEYHAKDEREFPKRGDKYYFIVASGGVDWLQWDESGFGLRAQDIGNIFRTKEQAEFAVEKLKVEAELRKFSKPFEILLTNWLITREVDGAIEAHWSSHAESQGTLYFESEEKAQQAIETVGIDRIKKYIFGVED